MLAATIHKLKLTLLFACCLLVSGCAKYWTVTPIKEPFYIGDKETWFKLQEQMQREEAIKQQQQAKKDEEEHKRKEKHEALMQALAEHLAAEKQEE